MSHPKQLCKLLLEKNNIKLLPMKPFEPIIKIFRILIFYY